ncbi:MAG: ECF transporter S component [Bacillus sp. (in: firmicutes)]
MKSKSIKKFVAIGMFGSISYILMLLNFPFPGFPTFLNVDFSDIPALIAAIIFGPLAGVTVELLKNVLDYAMTGSEVGLPIGHAANFVAGIAFVLPAYFVYKKFTTKTGLLFGLVTATVAMAIIMAVMNYFVFLPAYTAFGGWSAMSTGEAIKFVTAAILPFNIIKGVLITGVFILLFGKLKVWIEKVTPTTLERA